MNGTYSHGGSQLSSTTKTSAEKTTRKSPRKPSPAKRGNARKPSSRRGSKASNALPQERGDRRRKAILWALHDCMIKKGYAKTTLADVADAAGMYPSHLLYYFDGKDAILQQFFQNVANHIVQRLDSFRGDPPRQQIEALTKLFFAGTSITKSEIGMMLECFGAAVNDKVLQYEKEKLDVKCKAYLEELLAQTPRGFLESARDSAEVAYATLIGLRTAVYFDDDFELDDGHRLFHDAMLRIAGIDAKT